VSLLLDKMRCRLCSGLLLAAKSEWNLLFRRARQGGTFCSTLQRQWALVGRMRSRNFNSRGLWWWALEVHDGKGWRWRGDHDGVGHRKRFANVSQEHSSYRYPYRADFSIVPNAGLIPTWAVILALGNMDISSSSVMITRLPRAELYSCGII